MDENRPSVIGGPASVLDVFGAPSDQVRPRLADRKNFHGPVLRHIIGCSRSATCIVQFTRYRNRRPRVGAERASLFSFALLLFEPRLKQEGRDLLQLLGTQLLDIAAEAQGGIRVGRDRATQLAQLVEDRGRRIDRPLMTRSGHNKTEIPPPDPRACCGLEGRTIRRPGTNEMRISLPSLATPIPMRL